MLDPLHPMNKEPLPASLQPLLCALSRSVARLLLTFSGGLGLGALGNSWGWNRLENPWPFFGLLCPLLLGLLAGLLGGGSQRHAWLRVLGASLLAWSGFFLTFLVFAQIHWFQMIYSTPPDPAANDPTCSPCFDFKVSIGFSLQDFFPLGLVFVSLIALATTGVLKAACWFFPRRPTPPSHGS